VADFPEWLEPMAATLTQERFSGPEWVFERKYDGIRLIAFKQKDDVRLYSRNRLPQNLPNIQRAIAGLPVEDAILDGEITWDRQSAYHVFDVLWLGGRSVTQLPLDERRALLGKLPLKAPLQRVPAIDEAEPWTRACAEGWEGVIAKRRDSLYEHRRSKSWLKMKCELTHEFVVGGFTDPQGARFAVEENRADILTGADLSQHDAVVATILIDLAQRDTNNKSIAFADIMADELAKVTSLVKRHRRFAGFAVLKSPDIPSVLLELGYLSNPVDARNLAQPNYRAKLGQAIVRSLDQYFAVPRS
jgi:N-acetylmuramoyl-L-alanine amidase/ATP dependent DNA ligase domain